VSCQQNVKTYDYESLLSQIIFGMEVVARQKDSFFLRSNCLVFFLMYLAFLITIKKSDQKIL